MPPETIDPVQMAMLQMLMSGFLQQPMVGAGIVPGGDDGNASTDENRSLTFARNFNSYLMDPATGMLAGPQAFSAEQFAPVETREAVDLPGARLLTTSLAGSPMSLNRLIAEEIAAGGDENTAFAKIRNIVNGANTDPETREMVLTQIQPLYGEGDDFTYDEVIDPETGLPRPDWTALKSQIDDFAKQVRSDPGYDDADMELFQLSDGTVVELPVAGYKVTQEDAPMTQKFRELGLPTPFEQYQIQDFMPQYMRDRESELTGNYDQARSQAQAEGAAARASREQERAMLDSILSLHQRNVDRASPRTAGPEAIASEYQGLPTGAPEGMRADVFASLDDDDVVPGITARWLGREQDQGGVPQPLRSGRSDRDVQSAIQNAFRKVTADQMNPFQAQIQRASQAEYDAYKKYAHGRRRMQSTPEYANALSAIYDAYRNNRTPLSDVLTGRRAQATAAGVPQRSYTPWMG